MKIHGSSRFDPTNSPVVSCFFRKKNMLLQLDQRHMCHFLLDLMENNLDICYCLQVFKTFSWYKA